MKILLTSHRFWPHVGGTEEAVGQLAAAYARRGHAVTVATSDEPGSPETETHNGYEVRRFTLERRGKFRFPPPAYRKFVLEDPWDVVHLTGQRVWSTDYLYRHLKRAVSPVVFTAHGFYQAHVGRIPLVDDLYYRVVLPRSLRHVAMITADTSAEHDELVAWGVPTESIRIIPLGLDLNEFEDAQPRERARQDPQGFRAKHGIPTEATVLLYVGGFYPNKRVDRCVEAAARAGATLVVIGKEGDARYGLEHCRALADRLGADVRFLGLLPREDVLAAYRESDIFLLASDFEGFGLVLLEAMASGLPFVATRAGTAPDVAAQGAGISTDAASFPGEVARLAADPKRRAAMGRAGNEAAAQYAWGNIAQRFLSLYDEVRR